MQTKISEQITTKILKRRCSVCRKKFTVKNKTYFKCLNCEFKKEGLF